MARTGNDLRIPILGTYSQTSGAATFGTDLTDVSGSVAQIVDKTVANTGALPGTGNWYGRTIRTADNGFMRYWDGAAWTLTHRVSAADDATRAALFPSVLQGDLIYRTDKGFYEQYHATYNASTNPGGATPAGWYPTGSGTPEIRLTATTSGNWSIPANNTNALVVNARMTPSMVRGMTWNDGLLTLLHPGSYRLSVNISATTPSASGNSSPKFFAMLNASTLPNQNPTNSSALLLESELPGSASFRQWIRGDIKHDLAKDDVIRFYLESNGPASSTFLLHPTLRLEQISVSYEGPTT